MQHTHSCCILMKVASYCHHRNFTSVSIISIVHRLRFVCSCSCRFFIFLLSLLSPHKSNSNVNFIRWHLLVFADFFFLSSIFFWRHVNVVSLVTPPLDCSSVIKWIKNNEKNRSQMKSKCAFCASFNATSKLIVVLLNGASESCQRSWVIYFHLLTWIYRITFVTERIF